MASQAAATTQRGSKRAAPKGARGRVDKTKRAASTSGKQGIATPAKRAPSAPAKRASISPAKRAPSAPAKNPSSTGKRPSSSGKNPSSQAPTDLRKERERFVRTFLKKGVELTESLLEENRALNGELAQLRSDNARLRKHVASDGAIRELLKSIDALETEKNDLLDRSSVLEQQSQRYEGRQAEIEQELSDLANLYVASVQLHNRISPRAVLQHVKELLAQLVGAEAFVVYLVDGAQKRLVPVASEGLPASQLVPASLGEGPLGEACLTGVIWMSHDEPLANGTLAQPLAIVPLRLEQRSVGVLAVVSMLAQKNRWAAVDHELFKLLSDQAGVALARANLFLKARGPFEALAGLIESL